jgi:sensor c-di-GMP phosphodiesterase-like protein
MTHHNSPGNHPQRRRRFIPLLDGNLIPLIVIFSVLPTIVLLVLSYFNSVASARTNLEGIIKRAALKTDQLLEDGDAILHRSKVDLQNADAQTTVKILQRQIYNDFRFREAGVVNPAGLITLSSLGVIDPPVPSSIVKQRFDPNDPNLQILGPGRTQLMQERSIALALRGSGKIGSLYLLVDPAVLNSFLETIPALDLGPDGFIAFMTSDQRLLSLVGAAPEEVFASLEPSAQTIQVSRMTQDGQIKIVGQISRSWVLRDWLRELLIVAPLTIAISSVLSYLLIRQAQINSLDLELKRGLARNEFEVHYQPIVDLATRRCVGSEALLRWRHPYRGLIYPHLFIPIAEQTELIIPITEWLIARVIQDQALLKSKCPDLYMSVNLSPTQLNIGDVDRLIQMLKGEGDYSQTKITFEITENKLIEEQGQVVQDAIARLKLCGARLAIDDFGTGYSNIAYLERLDVDQLKLDQLFVKGLSYGNSVNQLVDSLIDFGNRVGLTIIAEGIETETQYQYLKERGVQYGQGWLFSRPLPLIEFEQFLQDKTAPPP